MSAEPDLFSPAGAGVRIEDGFAVIRVPLDRVHALRVSLAECPCRASKSLATAQIRRGMDAALAKAISRGRT